MDYRDTSDLICNLNHYGEQVEQVPSTASSPRRKRLGPTI